MKKLFTLLTLVSFHMHAQAQTQPQCFVESICIVATTGCSISREENDHYLASAQMRTASKMICIPQTGEPVRFLQENRLTKIEGNIWRRNLSDAFADCRSKIDEMSVLYSSCSP